MKLRIYIFFILTAFLVSGCKKEEPPVLENINPLKITLSDAGEKKTVSFTCNKNWTVESSESWCTFSASSGAPSGAEDQKATFTLIAAPNDTYDERSCTITIHVAELTGTITVTQNTNKGIIATDKEYNISYEACILEVEVKANVQFNARCSADWIVQTESKALDTHNLFFEVKMNKYFEGRTATITLTDPTLKAIETIQVKQEKMVDPPFMNETIYGVYGLTEDYMNKRYVKYEDQTSVTLSSKRSFRIQNPAKEQFISFANIPLEVNDGETFDLEVLQNYMPNQKEHLALPVQVMKTSGNSIWLYNIEECLGFIVKK